MISAEELARTPFFENLDAEERALLSGIARKITAATGERIFEEGSPSHTLYVVIDGLVSLRRGLDAESGGTSFTAGHPGEVIGISAMLGEKGVHPVSGVCLQPTELIEIDAPELMAALESKPEVGFRILRRLTDILSQRLDAARAQIRSQMQPGLISHG